jgi:hypothetical protein
LGGGSWAPCGESAVGSAGRGAVAGEEAGEDHGAEAFEVSGDPQRCAGGDACVEGRARGVARAAAREARGEAGEARDEAILDEDVWRLGGGRGDSGC